MTILFGPSGSGKSTTLAAIAGFERPARGRIALGDAVWFDEGVDVPVEQRQVAMVFQSLALFPHMSALNNVMYGMDRAAPKVDRVRRAKDLLERFGVGHLALRRPKTFSGGEAQRVALARDLGMSPKVVLLDEPFSAADHELRKALSKDVRASAESLRIPFLHVTHHKREARWLGDHVVRFERGCVVAAGALDDVLPHEDEAW